MRTWTVTVNAARNRDGWTWRRYLTRGGAFHFGGPRFIRSAASYSRVEAMREGDLVFANQTGVGVVGMTRLGSDGYRSSGGDGPFDGFDLDSGRRIWFENPVPVSAIRTVPGAADEVGHLRCSRPTVGVVSRSGRALLAGLAAVYNPQQAGDVRGFVGRALP